MSLPAVLRSGSGIQCFFDPGIRTQILPHFGKFSKNSFSLLALKKTRTPRETLGGSELEIFYTGCPYRVFRNDIGPMDPDTHSAIFLKAALDLAPFAIAVVVTKKFTVHCLFQIQSLSLMLFTGIGTGTAVNFTRPKTYRC
jgi:hypothetical protein